MNAVNLDQINQTLADKSPDERILWGLDHAKNPIITTKFGPFSATLLHMVTRHAPDIPVLWADNGLNTPETYAFAAELIEQLKLNIHVYIPQETPAHLLARLGGKIPTPDQTEHSEFSRVVKLEPFARGLTELAPDLWFTSLRQGQTEFRNSIEIASRSQQGLLKISPAYEWTSRDLWKYNQTHGLREEHNYVDPVKGDDSRECGIHLL